MRTNLKRLICGVCVCALVISCVPMTGCGGWTAATWRDGKVKEGDVTESAENVRAYYDYDNDPDQWREFITSREYDESSEDGDETVYYSYSEDDDEYTPIHGHDVDTDDEDADPVYRLTADGTYKRVKNYESPSDAEIAAQDDDVYYLKIDADGDDELENFTVVHGYNLEEGDEVYDLVDGEFVAMEYVTPEPEEVEDADEEDEEDEDSDEEESAEDDAYDDEEGDGDSDSESSENSGYYTEEDGSYEAVATEDLVEGETYYQMSEDGDEIFEEVTYNGDDEGDGTVEEYRAYIIKEKILGEFVDDEVERRDLTVSQKKVDKEVEEAREETEAQYMDGVFESVLQSYGYADLEAYEETVEEDLLEDKLMCEVTGMDEDDDGYDESEAEELFADWLDDLYDNLLEVEVRDPLDELSYDPDVMEEDIMTRAYYSYDEDEGKYTEIDDILDIDDGDTVYYKDDDGAYEEYEWETTYYEYDEDSDEYSEIDDTSALDDGEIVYVKNAEGEYVERTWEADDEDADEETEETEETEGE